MSRENFHIVLTSRPGVNHPPVDDDFSYESCSYPELSEGCVIVKTTYLSTDPALRCRMNEETGVQYMLPWQLGQTVDGFGGLGVVVESKSPSYKQGDVVYATSGFWPWKLYFDVDTSSKDPQQLQIQKVDVNLTLGCSHRMLTCYPVVGLTALLGIREKGHVTPGANQTIVISGAAGACGSLAGQIARIDGCTRVVGICGSDEKCNFLVDVLEFDGAINYKTKDVAAELKLACPGGIDIYFDNVGGELSDTVIRQMNENSHVILCGQIAVYNKDVPYPPPLPMETENILKEKHITRDRFLVLNYADKFKAAIIQLAELLNAGKFKVKETTTEGLEKAGKAFVSMMNGGNIGKQLVHVAD